MLFYGVVIMWLTLMGEKLFDDEKIKKALSYLWYVSVVFVVLLLIMEVV